MVCASVGTSVVFKPEGRVMCWAITAFGTDCSGGTLVHALVLSTVKCCKHLIVNMNDSAMLPCGVGVVIFMIWIQG